MTINNLKLQDIWNMRHHHVQYTYFRNNYGSRLDRIYAADIKDNIINIVIAELNITKSC